MTWTLHRQQQQCGAQLPGKARQPGEVPREALADREGQDHEQAGEVLPPGDYPASPLDDRDQDNTPDAPEPRVQWDEVVQPERRRQQQGQQSDDPASPEGN